MENVCTFQELFCVDRASTDLIRDKLKGRKRVSALAVFVALHEIAADAPGNGSGFETTKRFISYKSGVGLAEVSSVLKLLTALGLLSVSTREGSFTQVYEL
jgi:hypothetical protein